MFVLLISPLTEATGNRTTANRIGELLEQAGNEVHLLDCGCASAREKIRVALAAQSVSLIVAIHAYKAGRLLVDEFNSMGKGARRSPFVLVLGGTDINVDVPDAANATGCDVKTLSESCIKLEYLSVCIRYADAVVAFTSAMAERYREFAKLIGGDPANDDAHVLAAKLRIIPQAVDSLVGDLTVSPAGCPVSSLQDSLRAQLGLTAEDRLLVLVASIRPVKDPLYLLEAIAEWHAADPHVHLVIIGPVLDESLFEHIREATGCESVAGLECHLCDTNDYPSVGPPDTKYSGAGAGNTLDDCDNEPPLLPPEVFGGKQGLWYHPPVPREQLLRWLASDAHILLNSSVSEGQCGAILEAMALGVPVVARHNEGNASLIHHGVTGLLYGTPQEAVQCCKQIFQLTTFSADSASVALQGCDDSSSLRERLTSSALEYVQRHHSAQAEANAWREVLIALDDLCVGSIERANV